MLGSPLNRQSAYELAPVNAAATVTPFAAVATTTTEGRTDHGGGGGPPGVCAGEGRRGGESPGPPPSQPRIYSAHWGCGRNPTTTATTRTLTRVSMVSIGAHRTPPRPTPRISPFIHRRLY
ncbi:unnamed protein product [Sphagnum tenellum]